MIAEARVHAVRHLDTQARSEHGALVLVMRQWPRGLRRQDVNYWVQSAAPSQSLLDAYRAGLVSWSEFEGQYKDEQANLKVCRVVRYMDNVKLYDTEFEKSALDVLKALQELHGKITLLCWENNEFCHRHTLKSLLDEHETVKSR